MSINYFSCLSDAMRRLSIERVSNHALLFLVLVMRRRISFSSLCNVVSLSIDLTIKLSSLLLARRASFSCLSDAALDQFFLSLLLDLCIGA